ncbi:MAG: HAMP domain-containing histidine kinase [Bacteroidia bacterium]|nr:HAMP domain-containing histidine kinase [Bacteroidia bacterium]MCZ2277061.1 HAMP domain-containing histidine kinase [Bacteroidia bacterium]
MNRFAIRLIILLMSASLIGIILLQVYWLRHDYLMNEQQFDHHVQESLNHTVQKADARQILNFISHKYLGFESDSTFWQAMDSSMAGQQNTGNAIFTLVNSDSSGFNIQDSLTTTVQSYTRDTLLSSEHLEHEKLIIRSDSASQVTEIDHVRISEKESSKDKVFLKNELLQAEVEKKRIRLEQEMTRLKVKLSSKVNRINEVMTGIALSYATSDDNPLSYISLQEVDTILNKELRYRGIELPYTFGILDTKKDSLITSYDSVYYSALRNSKYKTELFPDELYSRGLILLIYFPSRTSFVLSTIGKMMTASALFSLTIIIVFIYTVNMLLKQKKISEIKSDFINNMTHEFKTPIATISLAIDAINNPRIAEDKSKVGYYSNIIREENRRMNRQVETILQTAMFEKGDFSIKREPVDLHKLVQKSIDNMLVQVSSRGGWIHSELRAINPVVEGDELMLTTAIINLLDNANKYSPTAPEITVRTESREGGIVLSVEDKGMGMDKETISRIFEKFFRKSSGNIHDVKGFGLGLNHVKSIVEAHAGEVRVISKEGEGSCFSIFFPQNNI